VSNGEPATTGRGGRLKRNAVWQAVLQLTVAFSGLYTMRLLDPSTYGLWGSVVASQGMIADLTALWSGQTTIKLLSAFLQQEEWHKAAAVVRLSYWIDISTGALVWLLLIVLAPWLAGRLLDDPALVGQVRLFGAATLARAPHFVAMPVLQARDRYATIFWIGLLCALGRLAGVVILGWLPVERRLSALVELNIGLYALQSLLSWRQARSALAHLPWVPYDRRMFRLLDGHWREFWSTLLSSNLVSRVGTFTRDVDIVLISAWFGPAATGLFASAKRTAGLLDSLTQAVQMAISPEFGRLWGAGRYEQARRLLRRACLALALGCGALAACSLLALGPLVRAFLPKYVPSLPAMQILIVVRMTMVAAAPFYTFLVSTHQPMRTVTVYTLIGAAQIGALALVMKVFTAPHAEASTIALHATVASVVAVVVNVGLHLHHVRQVLRDAHQRERLD